MPSIQGIRRNFKKNWALMKRAQKAKCPYGCGTA